MNDKTIKVAIVGLGNCASSLIQGIEFYKNVDENSPSTVGLMSNSFGGYLVRDIKIVAAFDVNARKVGKDISEAIFAEPNCTKKISDVPHVGVKVSAGPVLDGVAPHMRDEFPLVEKPDDVDDVLKKSGAEIIVSYLPVGSEEATIFWAERALANKIAFINAIPVFVSSDKEWSEKFKKAGIPCAGDDVKSQVGATIVHRMLARLIQDRGHSIDNTYQLNVGGNSDFLNMKDESRVVSKRISKTEAVTSVLESPDLDVKIGPSDFVEHLKDNKVCYINIKGRQFGIIPFELDVKLSVEDSPNSAGVMVDAIRAIKIALDRGLSGYQDWSSYYFKHPLRQYRDEEAREVVEKFVADDK